MSSDGDVVDFVRVSDLDLDALTERREELREDDLLIPNGLIAALLDRRLPLKKHSRFTQQTIQRDQRLGDQGSDPGPDPGPDPGQSPHQAVHEYFHI